MRFSCCRHCQHDPVFPLPGHDITCQRPDCIAGRSPHTDDEPDRGSQGCAFRSLHRERGQVSDLVALVRCGCGSLRIAS